MLTVISPAKKLDETVGARPVDMALTTPDFLEQAWELAKIARGLSVDDLRRLMGISEPLARLNAARFAAFARRPAPDQVFAAVRCFAGDTYAGLEAASLSPDARHWADGHLRILSGLYGLLRPTDAIQPYRLEMGSRLANPRGADLYAFWGDRIAKALTAQAAVAGTDVLLNCASVEYFTAAARKTLRLRVVTPVFLDGPEGEAKVVSFWAKRARGALARHVCEHHLTDPADLRGFSAGGYVWQAASSTPDRPVFLRSAVQAA